MSDKFDEKKYEVYRKYVRGRDEDELSKSLHNYSNSDEYKQACLDELHERGSYVPWGTRSSFRPQRMEPHYNAAASCYCPNLFRDGHTEGCAHRRELEEFPLLKTIYIIKETLV